MEELVIKKLPENINRNGFVYKLVERTDKKAIYSQHSKEGKLYRYEIFKTKLRKLGRYDNPTDIKLYARKEAFPSDEEFGKRAWTYFKYEDAKKAFDAI